MAIDKEMRKRCCLQWGRMLVKYNRKKVQCKLRVVVGVHVFEVQLLWEISPWLMMMVSKERCRDPRLGMMVRAMHVLWESGKGLTDVGGVETPYTRKGSD